MRDMADGILRTVHPGNGKKTAPEQGVRVEVDESDLEMLEQGTLRVLRVKAKQRLDATAGHYKELEVNGESLPIVDVTVDPKRGMSAIVTVR
jgi:hypothetical protein